MEHGWIAITLSKKTSCRIVCSVPIFVKNKQYIFLKRKSSEKVWTKLLTVTDGRRGFYFIHFYISKII